MVDYSKWDHLELSDDSDIQVHPNVDKRSFIRAKQNQIHAERQQRALQIEALKYEREIDDALTRRLSNLLSTLKAQALDADANIHNPVDAVFRAIVETAPHDPDDDQPPQRPEGVFSQDQPLPTYSKMMVALLDDVQKKLDESGVEEGQQRFNAIVLELGTHLDKIQALQLQRAARTESLEKETNVKITSESYRVGFDSSSVRKADSGQKTTSSPEPKLLNPDFDQANAPTDSRFGSNATAGASPDVPRASPAAVAFAKIEPSNYRASFECLSSHPEILRESETDGLLLHAFHTATDESDNGTNARQYVHQALLLQYCRMVGRGGVETFFKGIAKPGHKAKHHFETEVTEKLARIQELAAEQRAADSSGVERIQIQAVEPGTAIQVCVPDADCDSEDGKSARAIFDGFTQEVRVALQSGSLDTLNQMLGSMDVAEAESLVESLGEAGCLNIEKEIIDTTSEGGKRHLQALEARVDDSHV